MNDNEKCGEIGQAGNLCITKTLLACPISSTPLLCFDWNSIRKCILMLFLWWADRNLYRKFDQVAQRQKKSRIDVKLEDLLGWAHILLMICIQSGWLLLSIHGMAGCSLVYSVVSVICHGWDRWKTKGRSQNSDDWPTVSCCENGPATTVTVSQNGTKMDEHKLDSSWKNNKFKLDYIVRCPFGAIQCSTAVSLIVSLCPAHVVFAVPFSQPESRATSVSTKMYAVNG